MVGEVIAFVVGSVCGLLIVRALVWIADALQNPPRPQGVRKETLGDRKPRKNMYELHGNRWVLRKEGADRG